MKGHNEGNIKLRADGRYEVRVTAGTDFATGKAKRISYYAKTKAEAVQILHEKEYDIHFNKQIDPTSITLEKWLTLWLETYMKNSIKQSTYVSYSGYIRNHYAPSIGKFKLKDVTSKLLQDFYNYKLNDEGLSPKTIINMNLCLHKALKQAVLDRYLVSNPCDAVNLPRNEKPQIEVLTRDEQNRLIYTSYRFRYGVFIRLVLSTGLRLGELLGLKWEDIDFRSGVIHIRRTLNRLNKVDGDTSNGTTEIVFQTPKTKNSLRSIPLLSNMITELKNWKAIQHKDAELAGEAYIRNDMLVTNQLGCYIEPRTFKTYYEEILNASCIGHFTFHALRHTFATRALEQQMDSKTLSMILGHYSVSFTLDTYAHVLDNHKRQGMNLMEELFQPVTVPENNSYPVIVSSFGGQYVITAVDFQDISIICDSMEKGIEQARYQIQETINNSYPPIPTPYNEINSSPNEIIVMINL